MPITCFYSRIKTCPESLKALGKYFILFLAFLIVNLSVGAAIADPLPTFVDPAMQACMDQMALENNWQSAEEVTAFVCTDCGVKQLDGIEGLINLKRLVLSNNSIVDVGPLNSLSQLKRLILSGNGGIDFGMVLPLIHQNPGLTHLGINDIVIPDGNLLFLPPDRDFIKLALARTQLNDISQISLFPNLQVLNLGGNQIDGVSALQGLYHLKRLNLSNNPGIDFGMVLPLIDQNPNLTHLALNGITLPDGSLTFLPPDRDFVRLAFAGTQINNISHLTSFPNLEILNLKNNQITDVTALQSMTKLKLLNLSHNAGIDFGMVLPIIDQNPGLTHLGLNDIAIPFGEPPFLNPEANVVALELANTGINTIGNLIYYLNLEVLDLGRNQIDDLSALQSLQNLEWLDLNNNPFMTDLTPLFSLTGLNYLNLFGNDQLQCAELDILEGSLPPETVIRPSTCMTN